VIPRGTQEWREAHRGKVSASDAGAILARVGSKRRAQLVERLALNVLDGEGLETEEFPEPWQEQHEADLREAAAGFRLWFEQSNDGHLTVIDGGLFEHPVFPGLVASPHLLLGDAGCVLLRPRHTLKSYHEHRGKLSRAYRARVQLTLFVCRRQWCTVADFWGGRGLVPDRIHAQRVELENEWFQEHVVPALVALWQSLRATR
jgi:hypothetical protein